MYPSTGGGRSNSTLASLSELKSSMLPPPAKGREGEGEREGAGERIEYMPGERGRGREGGAGESMCLEFR